MSVAIFPSQLPRICGRVLLAVSCLGCGPVVGTDDVEASTTTTTPTPETTSGLDPSTSGSPPNPTTASPTSTTSVGTSTTTGGSSSSEGSSDEVGGFITKPDGGACAIRLPDGVLGHCTIECSVQYQDCPRDEACRAWANDGGDVWNASLCAPVEPDPAALGEPCVAESSPVSGIDTCDRGLMCWNVDSMSLEGTCAQYCGLDDDTPSCSEPGAVCAIANEGALPLCLPGCDPLAPTCSAGFGCYPGSEENFVCVREGDRMHIDGLFHPDCPSGTFWASAEQVADCTDDDPCCVAYCQTSDPGACGLDFDCAAFFEDPPPEYADLGYCRPAGG